MAGEVAPKDAARTADIHDVGLLSNFRKQSAAVEPDETPALDFEFGDEPDQEDEQWLQAVDRRKPVPPEQDADPFLTGMEPDGPETAPTAAFPASAGLAPEVPATPTVPSADAPAEPYMITSHAQPATLMSPMHSEPMAMDGQPDFPAEAPPAPKQPPSSMHEQDPPTPVFESYDLVDTEDPPVAFAYAEEVQKEIVEVQPVAGVPSPPTEPEDLPDLGMVFAGLSNHGIVPAVPVAPPVAPEPQAVPPAPPQMAPIDISFGPLGPQAVPHLQTMGLTVGVSWPQVTQARRTLMEQNPADGTAEQQYRRTEVNHASASLRLLRVGPLPAV
ncbi:MAG: hypothetical protein HKN03_09820 [Acidimicrobiales bacterium]|nr:hypothetical protein [Acidimicrobiales bacterium]